MKIYESVLWYVCLIGYKPGMCPDSCQELPCSSWAYTFSLPPLAVPSLVLSNYNEINFDYWTLIYSHRYIDDVVIKSFCDSEDWSAGLSGT